MKIKKVVAAARCLVEDLEMLASGEWVPDEGSIQASLENAMLVLDSLEEREV